jgi:hypothetical protein
VDVTYDLLPDPRYYPLPPSVDDLLTFAEELDYEGNNITFEWADNEIKNHLLSYVRVGLIAAKVKLYRTWRHASQKFKDFKDYCEKGLGKSRWYVNRMIEAARVTLELMKAGFTQLPQHESQARPLVKFQGEDLIQKWEEVITSLPAHRITAAAISKICGEPEPEKKRVLVSSKLWEKLRLKALELNLSPEQLLEQLLDGTPDDAPQEPEEEPLEPLPDAAPITLEQMTRWVEDMQQLLIEQFGLTDCSTFFSS